MKTQNIETLLPKIVPLLPGCNDDIAIISLADAARTFARESDIIVETKSYDENEAPAYGRIPEFAEDQENFLPHHFVSYEKDPNNKRIYVTYSLLPTARLFPAAILARHYEAIVEYAMFMLCNMPGKPWTNTDLANFHYQKYRTALGDAIRDNSTNGAVFDQSIVLADDYGYQGGLTVTVAGNGTDTSDATATADQLVYPATAYVKGEKITGKIRNVTASISGNVVTVPKGNIAQAQTLTVEEMKIPTVSGNVVTIYQGYNKNQRTETIPESAALSVSGNVVTVPVGYIKSQRTATVAEATVTETGDSVTITPGYVAEELNYDIGGSDIDLSGVTVTADKMLSGIVAVGADGNKVTGNIQTVSASSDGEYVTVPAGFHASEQKFPITVTDGGGYDTSSVTATADTMLAGVIAIGKNGETITGNIQTVTPSVNKNTFTVGKGYVAEAFSQTIAESGASNVSGNVVTVPAGYLSTDRVETIAEATVTETDTSVDISVGYLGTDLHFNLGSVAGEDVTYGYVTQDNNFQPVDMSGDQPEKVGEPQVVEHFVTFDPRKPLRITALVDDVIIQLNPTNYREPITDLNNKPGLQGKVFYRVGSNDIWKPYTFGIYTGDPAHWGGNQIMLPKAGNSIEFMGIGSTFTLSDNSDDAIMYIFSIFGKAELSGEVRSLVNYGALTPECFKGLFASPVNDLVVSPDILPSTELANACYANMFEDCTLNSVPSLPASVLAESCYAGMCRNSKGIKTFSLPATVLARQCCSGMFRNSSIESVELPAAECVETCYASMVSGCSNLTTLKVGFTEWHENATSGWMNDTAETGEFIKPTELSDIRGESRIPENWTVTNF